MLWIAALEGTPGNLIGSLCHARDLLREWDDGSRSVSRAERGSERGREASRAHRWLAEAAKAPNDVLARELAAMGLL